MHWPLPVHDGDQIHKAPGHRDIGHVGRPDLVRAIDHEAPQQLTVRSSRSGNHDFNERYSHLTIDSMANASGRVSDILNGTMPVTTTEPEPETVGRDG